MIAELTVLLCIKHLKHSGCGIPLIITAHLIDLIKQHQRIFHARTAQSVYDTSRHRTNISFSVSADLSLITHTAQTDAHIFFIKCACH